MTAPWASGWGRSLLLAVFCLALWLPGLTTLPPFDRDEARFAQASRQMVESGDYIDIRFQDQPRHKKPVGIYWLQSASVQMTGVVDRIWSYRIPSLLGAMTAVLLAAAMGARFISPVAGLLAGGLLASCLLLGVEARMAKTDAVLLASILAVQFVLMRLYLERTLPGPWAFLFWAALAGGVLIKGPIILLAVGGPVVFLSILHRSPLWLKPLRPAWGLPLFLLLVLPWLIAITIKSGGQFWAASVGKDLLAKAVSEQESKGAPPGFYFLTFFITFWPWAPLALLAAVRAWRDRTLPLVQFCLAWILPFWWLFEMFPTKLLHYTLPTFPAVALLVAHALDGQDSPLWLRRAVVGLGAVMVGVVALAVPLAPLAIFATLGHGPFVLRQALSEAPVSFLGLASGLLLIAAALVAYSLRTVRPKLAAGMVLVALLNFYAVAHGYLLPRLDPLWVSRSAARMVEPYRLSCPGAVVSVGYAEPSLVFLLGTDTRLLADTGLIPAPTEGCQLVLVESRKLGGEFTAAGARSSISGLNYSKGDPVTLYLFERRRTGP